MSWIRFFHRHHWDEERARELEAYLETETDENIDRGMSPEEACYAARRKLGNTTLIREEIYHMNGLGWLEALWLDLRYAVRMLRRSSGFTAVAVITLALGIGVTTAMFSLIESVLFQPIPATNPAQLVAVYTTGPYGAGYSSTSYPDYEYYRDYTHVFSGVMAYARIRVSWTHGDRTEFPWAEIVSGNYFTVQLADHRWACR